MKKWNTVFILLSILILFTGCGDSENNLESDYKSTIYTTIYPLQFIVDELAGDFIHAETVYPPGVDEHTYEPTAQELTQIADGDAFIYIGAGLEAMAETAASALENQDVKLIEIGDHEELFLTGDSHHHEENEQHNHGDIDPHLWLDPLKMIDMAHIISNELIDLYPDKEKQVTENIAELEEKLLSLDNDFNELIADIENKTLLVTHAAFGYWEEQYGIEQIAIHGVSTENEPSQKELISIIETAGEHDLDHIVFEQNVTTRVAEIIQDEMDAEAVVIHNLAVLTEDDLAEDCDYISIMQDNLDVLGKAMN
jgi:zinc transport system substrate-binding protein